MVVQQHILNWLYSVLQSLTRTQEYQHVDRTYNDVANVLSQHPSLAARTDVYTFPGGSSALLLHLAGTIPVIFRGTTYRFPLELWLPYTYPRDAPLAYVTPTENMIVRPGQHVDPQGQVYHPYLADWSTYWDKSNLVDFLAILRDVFAKEPPVISKRQPTRVPRQDTTPQPVPPLLSDPVRPASVYSSVVCSPPKPPPKPKPCLPSTPEQPAGSRYQKPAPLPQQLQPQDGETRTLPTHVHRSPPQYLDRTRPTAFLTNQTASPIRDGHAQAQYSTRSPIWSQSPAANVGPPQSTTTPPDLMDQDLSLAIPSPSSLPAPPIPPNPEKDALLRQLAHTLDTLRQHARSQDNASLVGLAAQRKAMLAALATLRADAAALSNLSALLASNTAIVKDSLRQADLTVSASTDLPPPDMDDLLVAPTVAANQLYDLVAEERALADAVFVLGRAVERGRVAPGTFARMTRTLAREWYLKKALVRKIGEGMGLTV